MSTDYSLPFQSRDLIFPWLVPDSEGRKGKKKKLQTMQCGRDWLWDSHEKWEINSCGGIPHSLLALYFQCCVDDSRSESEPFVYRWCHLTRRLSKRFSGEWVEKQRVLGKPVPIWNTLCSDQDIRIIYSVQFLAFTLHRVFQYSERH